VLLCESLWCMHLLQKNFTTESTEGHRDLLNTTA
jgi:hypothetical protein